MSPREQAMQDSAPATGPVAVLEGSADQEGGLRRAGAGRVVMTAMLAPVLALGTSLPAWVQATVPSVLKDVTVQVKGTDAAPAVAALALVALAALLVVRMSNRFLRAVVCAVVALAGAGIAAAALAVTTDPASASATQVGKATGTTGTGGSYAVTAWPWLCLALGLLTVLAAVRVWLASRRWPVNSRRYARCAEQAGTGPAAGQNPHADDIDAWDSLTQGEDPTAGTGSERAGSETAGSAATGSEAAGSEGSTASTGSHRAG